MLVHAEHGGVLGKQCPGQEGTHGVQLMFHLDAVAAAVFLEASPFLGLPEAEHLVGGDVGAQRVDAVLVGDTRPVGCLQVFDGKYCATHAEIGGLPLACRRKYGSKEG